MWFGKLVPASGGRYNDLQWRTGVIRATWYGPDDLSKFQFKLEKLQSNGDRSASQAD